jgi:hypothetical protein
MKTFSLVAVDLISRLKIEQQLNTAFYYLRKMKRLLGMFSRLDRYYLFSRLDRYHKYKYNGLYSLSLLRHSNFQSKTAQNKC